MVNWLYEKTSSLAKGAVRVSRLLAVRLLCEPQSVLGRASQLATGIALLLIIAAPVYALTNTNSVTFASASSQSASKSSVTTVPSGAGDRTLSFWYKAVTNASTQCVFNEGSSAGSLNQWAVCVNINGAGTHDFAILLNGGNVHYTATGIDDGNWHNVVFTYSGGGAIGTGGKAYMDGAALTQSSTVANTPNTTASCIVLGGDDQTGTCSLGAFANAKVDDVRLWSRALSSSEVTSLFNSPCTFTNGASFDSWWQLEGNFNDSQGANSLTANNAPSFTTDAAYSCSAGASFNPYQFYDY